MMDNGKCTAQIFRNYHFYPCTRKAWKDGYCKQHHPNTVKARDEARHQKWEAEQKAWRDKLRLEIAAPKLLEACKEAMWWIGNMYDNPRDSKACPYNLLEQAIKEAEGDE